MKTTLVIYLLASIALAVSMVLADEKPWFDVKNCDFCKQFDKEPGLLENLENEYHNISNGVVSFHHIDKKFEAALARAQAGVGKVIQDMQSGKIPTTCVHCGMLGEFTRAGVRQEGVETKFGTIMIMTSPDSAMVAKLQDFGRKTAEATAKFKAERAAAKSGK